MTVPTRLTIVSLATNNPQRQQEILAGATSTVGAGGLSVHFAADEAAALAVLPSAEILLTWKFTPEMFNVAQNLRWLHLSGAGANHVLFDSVRQSDLIVTNTRGIHGPYMAEWVAAALFHISQQLQTVSIWRSDHDWKPHKDYIQRNRFLLRDKSALVFGMGSVGSEIAATLSSLGLKVAGITRQSPATTLQDTIGKFDVVVIAAPHTTETHQIFNHELLSKMKKGAILVNVARGKLLDETALIYHLQNGPLAFAALDVFENEPLPSDSPLFALPNLFMSPHVSGNFPSYTAEVINVFLENLARYVKQEPLQFIVDKTRGY